MVTIDEVRELAGSLPRSEEALVRDRVKFRVGRIVYLAFSRDAHGQPGHAKTRPMRVQKSVHTLSSNYRERRKRISSRLPCGGHLTGSERRPLPWRKNDNRNVD